MNDIQGIYCVKSHPQHGLNMQQAMIVDATRRQLESFVVEIFVEQALILFEILDQTAKKVGPLGCKIITPVIHPGYGINGWEASVTMKYDMGTQFRLSEDLDMVESGIELAVQKRYEKVQQSYERSLKDRIIEVQHYIQESQGKSLIPVSKDNTKLIQVLRNISDDFRKQNASPERYFNHKGIQYRYIVDEVIKDCLDNQGIVLKEEYQQPETSKINAFLRQQSESMDKKQLIEKKAFYLNSQPPQKPQESRKSIFSNMNIIKDLSKNTLVNTDSDSTTINRSQQYKSLHQLKNSNSNSNQILNSASVPKLYQKEHNNDEDNLLTLKQKLDSIVQPFQSKYNIDPQKISIIINDKPKRISKSKEDFQSYYKTLNQMNAESELIINLLEQNGISDCFDSNTLNKSQPQQPQQKLLNNIKQTGAQLKMAKEFNQTQYLFQNQTYKTGKNMQLVLKNVHKNNGESINDISLIKSPEKEFSRGISFMDSSKKQSFANSNSVAETDQLLQNNSPQSRKDSLLSINSFSLMNTQKIDFNNQLRKLISSTVDKMNQKGGPVQVDDTELKIQQMRRSISCFDKKMFKANHKLSPEKLSRILYQPGQNRSSLYN